MSNKAFEVFEEWIKERGYKWDPKLTKKELWKMFVADVKQCGIINVFKCSDYNKLKKLLGLSYVEDGWTISGPFKIKNYEWEMPKEKDKDVK